MIRDLLPRYYEVHKSDDTKYTTIQSAIIRGHEVAWMEFSGTVVWSGEPYRGRLLFCECDFKEGVGWQIDVVHGVTNIGDTHRCRYRKIFVRQRYMELRKEFLKRFGRPIRKHIADIIMALIEKTKAGEFIDEYMGIDSHGEDSKNEIWVCGFSLQTVASIVNKFSRSLHGDFVNVAECLVTGKKIVLEGYIVRPHYDSNES